MQWRAKHTIAGLNWIPGQARNGEMYGIFSQYQTDEQN
ncbi:hypothetical protein SAMN05216308_10232 [Nitrosospira sp. Nsp13]|nr:hypothetical protein SAMN05216308_10232 [Nitrosospira sp. Nsp13]